MNKCEQCIVREFSSLKALGKDELIKLAECKTSHTVKKGDIIFEEGEKVSVVSTSKGKGFQGVVKRHNFSGVGMRTHGQHDRHRAPGSIGQSSYPARVFKGLRMAGRMGNETVKQRNLKVAKIISDKNLILINGSVPGSKGSYVIIEK